MITTWLAHTTKSWKFGYSYNIKVLRWLVESSDPTISKSLIGNSGYTNKTGS